MSTNPTCPQKFDALQWPPSRPGTMPLTRHLYESDEVVAALQLSLRSATQGDTTAALFWTHELVVSDEAPLALQILRATWLRWGAPHDHYILTLDLSPSLCLRVAAACAAARGAAPIDLLNAAAAAAIPPPGNQLTVTKRQQEARQLRANAFAAAAADTGEIEMPTAGAWWLAFEGAIRTASYAAAIWYLQWAQPLLCANTIWAAIAATTASHRPIIAAFRDAATAHPTCQILHQTAAVLFLARYAQEIPPSIMLDATTLSMTEAQWVTWDHMTGRRAGRVLAIPAAALHAGTTRGALSAAYTNIDDCRNPLTLLPQACRFWRGAVALAGMTINPDREDAEFPSDDHLEAFHATHFPDDLPDEWSTADQQKSHGRGCAEAAPPDPSVVFVRDTYTEPGFSDPVAAVAATGLAQLRL
jgi:hypothetical protein